MAVCSAPWFLPAEVRDSCLPSSLVFACWAVWFLPAQLHEYCLLSCIVFLWLCFWASLLPRNSTCQRLWLDFRDLKCLGTFCWVRSINFWEVKYIWNYWGISYLICLELSRSCRRQNCFKSGRSGKKVEPPWTPAGISCLPLPPKPYKFLTTPHSPAPPKVISELTFILLSPLVFSPQSVRYLQ